MGCVDSPEHFARGDTNRVKDTGNPRVRDKDNVARQRETEIETMPPPGATFTGEGGVLPRSAPPQVTPRTVLVVALTVLVLALALFLGYELRQILRWVLIALFLAVALNPLVNWLHRHHVGRGLAIGGVYLGLALLIAAVGAVVFPPLVVQVRDLSNNAINLFQQPGGINGVVENVANQYGLGSYVNALRTQVQALPGRLATIVGPLLTVTQGVVSSVTAFVSILLITFFLLLDGEQFVEAALNLFAANQRPRLRRILAQSARAVYGYIGGNLILSLVCGIGVFAILTILRLPYAVALALVVGLLDLLPLVGATLGGAIVVLFGLFVDPIKGLIILVYFVVYQQLENNLLQPLIYGRSVKLHPLAVFLAVLVGGELLGILGALLAIPVAEMIRILIAEYFATRARIQGGTIHSTDESAPVAQVTADATGSR